MPSLIATGTKIPMTTNNKIDRGSLKSLIMAESVKTPSLSLETLWMRYTGQNPNMDSLFLADGGDSFSAVLIAEAFDNDDLVDVLLRKPFKDVLDCIKVKSTRTEKFTDNTKSLQNDEGVADAKRAKIIANSTTNKKSDSFQLSWKQNLEKCIDASPIIVQDKVVIGSHKGIFAAFDLISGKEHWKIQLDDRIEATATTDKVSWGNDPYDHGFSIGSSVICSSSLR